MASSLICAKVRGDPGIACTGLYGACMGENRRLCVAFVRRSGFLGGTGSRRACCPAVRPGLTHHYIFEYFGSEHRIDGGTEFYIGNRHFSLHLIQHS